MAEMNIYYQVKFLMPINKRYSHQNTNNPERTIRILREHGVKVIKVYQVLESVTQYTKQLKMDVTSEYLKG